MTAEDFDGLAGEVAEANPDRNTLARLEISEWDTRRLYVKDVTLNSGNKRTERAITRHPISR
jgi:hypothetical protein